MRIAQTVRQFMEAFSKVPKAVLLDEMKIPFGRPEPQKKMADMTEAERAERVRQVSEEAKGQWTAFFGGRGRITTRKVDKDGNVIETVEPAKKPLKGVGRPDNPERRAERAAAQQEGRGGGAGRGEDRDRGFKPFPHVQREQPGRRRGRRPKLEDPPPGG